MTTRLSTLLFATAIALGGCQRTSASSSKPLGPTEPPAARVVPDDPTAGLESHQFYGVYLQGQKAGWAEERIETLADGGVRVVTHVQLRIKRMGSLMTLELEDEVVFGPPPDGRLRSFRSVQTLPGGGQAVRRGEVRDGRLNVVVEAGGARTEEDRDPPKESVADTVPKLVISRLRAAGGGPITVWQYDRQQLRDVPVETTILSEKRTHVQGVPVVILVVKGVDRVRSLEPVNRITEGGRTLEMTIGPGLKLVLEDREVAQNPLVAAPDLYRLSVVPIDRQLGRPGSVTRLTVGLTGLPSTLSLSDARQQLSERTTEGGERRLTVRRIPLAEMPETPLEDAARARWLESTAFVDHDHPRVRALATRAAGQGTPLDKAVALTRAAHRALSYTLATAPMTASSILAGGKGDCTEYARLLVALLRAIGTPAREVSGMAYAGDDDPGFAFHAWVEAYVAGRWMPLDPTWHQAPVDATHIALSRDDPSAIIGLIGGLKARVIEVRR